MTEFVHMELNTSDREGAKKFYKDVFGWKFQDMNMPNGVYTMVSGAAGGVGGIQDNPMPGAPSNWLGYVSVKSLKQTIAKVEKAGGNVIAQHDIPGMGKLAVFVDPQGAAVAAWEPAGPAKPAEKATKKKAAKKKAAKKPAKKAAKKAANKPAKKAAKKPAKKAAKKAAKKPAKKAAKKAAKKPAKKAAKKPAKKAAKKKAAKKG